MLSKLSISNYAIINSLSVEFNSGLNTLTGETGAGKSILLGALGLILGNRADLSVLKNKSIKCVVEGLFESLQTGLIQDGENYFHRLILPRYFSNNVAVCDILSYTVSSGHHHFDSPRNIRQSNQRILHLHRQIIQ